jgi:hypothetical protein
MSGDPSARGRPDDERSWDERPSHCLIPGRHCACLGGCPARSWPAWFWPDGKKELLPDVHRRVEGEEGGFPIVITGPEA